MLASGFGCWSIGLVLLKLGLRPSFILNHGVWLFLGVGVGALNLFFWSWARSQASFLYYIILVSGLRCWSIGLPSLKPRLRPSFILNRNVLLFLDLDAGALGLSFGPWASDSASFLIQITNHYCFWAWMMGHWTCPFEAGPSAQLHSSYEIMICSGLGCWSIGLVLLKLGLRPSFIFNSKSYLLLDSDVGALDLFRPSFILNNKSLSFLDLDVGPLDLSLWSCACGPISFLITNDWNHHCCWTWMLEHWTCPFEAVPLAQLHS